MCRPIICHQLGNGGPKTSRGSVTWSGSLATADVEPGNPYGKLYLLPFMHNYSVDTELLFAAVKKMDGEGSVAALTPGAESTDLSFRNARNLHSKSANYAEQMELGQKQLKKLLNCCSTV